MKWCKRLDDWGFPARIDLLHGMVNSLIKKRPGGPTVVGKHWVSRFLDRHPDLATKYAGRLDRQRSYASNPQTVKDQGF